MTNRFEYRFWLTDVDYTLEFNTKTILQTIRI